jgi:hypothetical protein
MNEGYEAHLRLGSSDLYPLTPAVNKTLCLEYSTCHKRYVHDLFQTASVLNTEPLNTEHSKPVVCNEKVGWWG